MSAPALPARSFVGRHTELETMRAWRLAAATGSGTVGLIAGEAGIGKSRLVHEFAATLRGGRAPLVVQAECLERAPGPFAPLRALIATLQARGHVVAESLEPRARAVLQCLIAPVSPSESADFAALDRADVFAGILAVCAAVAARRTLVIVIEDIHWADGATLDVLGYLAPRIASLRLLIVATLRDTAGEASAFARAIAAMERAKSVRRLDLGPLGDSEVRSLVVATAAAGSPALSEADVAVIVRRSAGNPLFAEELLKGRLAGTRGSDLPRTLRAVLDERVRVLEDADRNVLVHAAVLGERFDVSLLATILDRDALALAPSLERARGEHLVVELEAQPGTFRFRHALTRESLYESMLAYVRRPLHERIARALERLPTAGARIDEIAVHWWEAGVHGPAQRAARAAGDAAMRLHAYSDAAFQYERAVACAQDGLERARLQEALGTAYRSSGAHQAAIEQCLGAAENFARAGAIDEGARALVFGCAELGNAMRTDEACAELELFLQRHGTSMSGRTRDLLESYRRLFEAERIDRFPDDDNTADPAPTRDDESAIRDQTARLVEIAKAGKTATFLAAAERVLAVLAATRDVRTLVQASTLNYLGLHALHLAEPGFARRMLIEVRRCCAPQALRPNLGYAAALETIDAFLAGRLDVARRAALAACDDAHFATARAVLGIAGPYVGLALGDAQLVAMTSFEPAAEAVLARGLRVQSDLAAAATACAWLATGRIAEARAVFDACANGLRVVSGLAFVAPAVARHASPAAVGLVLESLERLESRTAHRIVIAVAEFVRAIAAARFGNAPVARAAMLAANGFAELGWPMFEAQALELGGDFGGAAQRFAQCGAIVDARRCSSREGTRLQTPAGGSPAVLSPRERSIGELVARGLTNREIGEHLRIGEKTVEGHLASAYRKLGLRSRSQLAALIASGG